MRNGRSLIVWTKLLTAERCRGLPRRAGLLLGVLLSCLAGCQALPTMSATNFPAFAEPIADRMQPSNLRDWSPDMVVLPYAEIDGDQVRLHNVRNCVYRADDEYVIQHYDRTYDLSKLKQVDFVVVPFTGAPGLAHTLLSFGFEGGDFVSVSVEARLEKGESYSALLGAMRQFEIMYVLADERDVLLRRAKHRGADIYLYRTRATPEQARKLFLDVLDRVNTLYSQPEFYDTVANNCTSNIVQHLNRLQPGQVALFDPRVILPGYADRLAYEIGLLDKSKTFEQVRAEALISERANLASEQRDFSEQIRR